MRTTLFAALAAAGLILAASPASANEAPLPKKPATGSDPTKPTAESNTTVAAGAAAALGAGALGFWFLRRTTRP